jgi:hypothetical protein
MQLISDLYILSPKDVSSGAAPRRFAKRLLSQLAQAAFQFQPLGTPLTRDSVFLLQHIGFVMTPGAAQNVVNAFAQIIDDSGAGIGDLEFTGAGPVATSTALFRSWGDPIVIMPGEQLTLGVNFNAGVAVNQVQLTCIGQLLPRGNWQFGG